MTVARQIWIDCPFVYRSWHAVEKVSLPVVAFFLINESNRRTAVFIHLAGIGVGTAIRIDNSFMLNFRKEMQVPSPVKY
jgi:hypothetical protein